MLLFVLLFALGGGCRIQGMRVLALVCLELCDQAVFSRFRYFYPLGLFIPTLPQNCTNRTSSLSIGNVAGKAPAQSCAVVRECRCQRFIRGESVLNKQKTSHRTSTALGSGIQ